MGGNCTVDKSAKLVIEGCHNEDSTVATDSDSPKKKRAFNRKKSRRTKPNKENGGGLNVLGALQVLGNLSFRNCHTTSVGGAAYVGGVSAALIYTDSTYTLSPSFFERLTL